MGDKKVSCDDKGFSLRELVLVLMVIGILTSVLVPLFGRYMKGARERVCKINRLELQGMYEVYLEMDDVEHSEATLRGYSGQYKQKVCPAGGVISYVENEIRCSEHSEGEKEGNVPYL